VRHAGTKAEKMARAFGVMVTDKAEDRYKVDYYEYTKVEGIDIFFRRCNKARNEL